MWSNSPLLHVYKSTSIRAYAKRRRRRGLFVNVNKLYLSCVGLEHCF
jgi:hypothetical protein